MTSKEELTECVQLAIQRLPDDATLRDLIEELAFVEELEDIVREMDEGKFLTLEEFKRRTAHPFSK